MSAQKKLTGTSMKPEKADRLRVLQRYGKILVAEDFTPLQRTQSALGGRSGRTKAQIAAVRRR